MMLRMIMWRGEDNDVENDDVEEKDDDVKDDDVEEEDRSQDRGPHFVRDCAVETRVNIQHFTRAILYGPDWARNVGTHFVRACRIEMHVRTPHCGHTVWGKKLGVFKAGLSCSACTWLVWFWVTSHQAAFCSYKSGKEARCKRRAKSFEILCHQLPKKPICKPHVDSLLS